MAMMDNLALAESGQMDLSEEATLQKQRRLLALNKLLNDNTIDNLDVLANTYPYVLDIMREADFESAINGACAIRKKLTELINFLRLEQKRLQELNKHAN